MLPIHGLVNLSEVLTGAFCLGFFFYDFFPKSDCRQAVCQTHLKCLSSPTVASL